MTRKGQEHTDRVFAEAQLDCTSAESCQQRVRNDDVRSHLGSIHTQLPLL